MAIVIDFTKTDVEILSALLNARVPGLTLIPTLLTHGVPEVNSTNNRNTKITITGVANSGYTGTATPEYNRVALSVVPGVRDIVFPKGDAVNISELIPEINARFSINLTANDYTDGPLPALTGSANEEVEFTLTAKAGSLIYNGSVVLKIAGGELDLAVLFADPVLDGLDYAPPA